MLPSPFVYNLTLDHWESIAFHLAASETALGPPLGLPSLLLTSRHVYANTCAKNNARLYARYFRLKFDCSAPRRRLTDGWETGRCLATELIKRFTAMRRMRDHVFNMDDLWTSYLMMLENDGKNELHLLNWANLKRYLVTLIVARVHVPPQVIDTDPTLYALTIWLLWMSSSRETLKTEYPEIINHLSRVLHPLIATGYMHPSSYAPDTCFQLPLCGPVDFGNRDCSGPRPPKTQIVHYSHALTIAYPLATEAATLLWVLQAELRQDEQSFPRVAHSFPPNREIGNVTDWIGPTFEDIHDFHYHVRVNEPSGASTIVHTSEGDSHSPEPSVEGSRRYDEDWTRLVACHDLQLGDMALRGPVYQIGSLHGCWAGRFVEPHFDAHMNVLLGRRPSHHVSLFQKPLYWTLREHHCLNSETLSIGVHDSGVDDILNAWWPRGYTLEPLEDAILVHDPYTGQVSRYETFIPGDSAHYSKQSCDEFGKDWISSTADAKEISAVSLPEPGAAALDAIDANIDDDDEYVDYVEHLSSGISDILVTGETGSPGDAWGHYQVIGRVRPWDGFIVLLQIPDSTASHLGQWIFKGYIHDRNLVGRWRETSTSVGIVGLEGSFVVTRRDNS